MKTMIEGGTAAEEIEYWKAIVVDLKKILTVDDLGECIVGLKQQLIQANNKLAEYEASGRVQLQELKTQVADLEAENKKLRAHLEALQTLKDLNNGLW